jgi:D-alanine-D-alanine ligase
VDVAVPVLHGRFGEDGTVQACLEAAGIPYVGSGVEASAVAFDKVRAKEVASFHGIRTPRFEVVPARALARRRAEWVEAWTTRFGLPLVLKNPRGGSTLEVRVAREAGAVAAALDELLPGAERLMVEAYVRGRELTVGVLEARESGEPVALPGVEIRPRRAGFFDYHEKYSADGAEELCPAPLDPERAKEAQAIAVRIHGLLDLRAISRTDLMLDADGQLWFLEVNTLPGMTERGLVPLAARAAGMDFRSLVAHLVRTARR